MAIEAAFRYLRELSIQVVGDDFALLSDQWFSGRRVADHVRVAKRAWAFAAASRCEASVLAGKVRASSGYLIVGLIPGQNGWVPTEGDAPVRALLGPEKSAQDVVGLILEVECPQCACPHRPDGCAKCGGCHATNDMDISLYP